MSLHTAAEVARIVGCNESTIRRQAARAWASTGGCPAPLAKHPEWRVIKPSAPDGGQGCGWMLVRSEPSTEAVIRAQAGIILNELQAARELADRVGQDPASITRPYLEALARHYGVTPDA